MDKLVNEMIKINNVSQEEYNEKILTYSEERIANLDMDDICREILTKHGLPKSVSPFMEFLAEDKGGFESVNDFLKRRVMEGEAIPENEQLDNCYLFGFFNNCFLALDEEGEVVYIDCESSQITYANKDLFSFLKIMARFNTLVNDYIEDNPEGDFFEDAVNEELIQSFTDFITELDVKAVNENTFWVELIECIQDC